MSRRSRLFIQGLPHLVQLRGHNHDALFRQDDDYRHFLGCLDKARALYAVRLHAYSLARERILLLLSAPSKENLGRFMQYLGRSYVLFYNHRYARRGALWESRYGSCPVEPNAYFLLVKKFVECRDGVTETPYRSFADAPTERLTPHKEFLSLGANEELRHRRYKQFCQEPDSAAVIARIQAALEQNCLLATPRYSHSLENTLQRNLRPRHSGRPRKHYINPVEEWTWLEKQAELLLRRYCYREIRMPLLERWERELSIPPFSGSGSGSDFSVNHPALLRGDGTMGSLRMIAQHQQLQTTAKLWYLGAMFRRSGHDDKGIQQNQQLGVEAFGYDGISIELEHLMLQSDLFQALQLTPDVELKINTIGSAEEFTRFRDALRAWYRPLKHVLSPRQHGWLESRPERLLQSEDLLLRRLGNGAPQLADFLSLDSRRRFTHLCDALSAVGLPFTRDPLLFPVNDYNHLLFEWHSDKLQGGTLLCRGGRYDDSASRLVGKAIHACGFAFMIDPIMKLLRTVHHASVHGRQVDVVIIPAQPRAHAGALLLGRTLRAHFPQLSIVNDCSALRLATRQKNALRQGARFILLVSDDDAPTLCDQESGMEKSLPVNDVIDLLSATLIL